ncbi:hypothetical protein AB4Z21_25070 [Paenibacillus sp. MCAF20]
MKAEVEKQAQEYLKTIQ